MASRGMFSLLSARSRRGLTVAWVALFLSSLFLQYASFSRPGEALASYEVGAFEADGNAVTNHGGGGLPDDWDRVFAGSDNADSSIFITDGFDAGDDILTGGNTKDGINLSSWLWKVGSVQDKDDIEHAFAAAYTSGGQTYAYFGLDRYQTSGDATAGFWFFKNKVAKTGAGVAPGSPFSGVHAIGDILVVLDFSNGGATATAQVYTWTAAGLTAGVSGTKCGVTPTDNVCAIANVTEQPAPWSYDDKAVAGTSNPFPANALFEGALNLTALGLDSGCFSSFMAETRASNSTTSTLSDFALGQFSFCVTPNLSTQVSQSSMTVGDAGVSDTAHLSGSKGVPQGTVDFFLCGPTAAAQNCNTGGTDAGAGKVVDGSGDAVSSTMAPAVPGWYCFRAEYTPSAGSKYLADSHTNSTTECFQVLKKTPTIVTFADETVSAGDAISDSATLSGGFSPTGSITFRAYGPNDATCSGAAVFTSSAVTVSGNGTYGPVSFTPAVAGTYRWIASYTGDANNNAVGGACNDVGETDTVSKVNPAIVTSANETVTIGASISDSATLSGGVNPTGSIIFRAYGPDDATCSGAAVFTSSAVTVNGNGTYGPASFTPAAVGTYRWIATYSGDGYNNAVAGACNDAGEVDSVGKAAPNLVTSADQTVLIENQISDSATLSGGVSPTGTIIFRAYGPADATCSGAPAFTSSAVTVSGNGTYGPVSFTPTAVGTFHWIATYSGDANNTATAGACGDAGENDTVNKKSPTIATLLTDGDTSGTNLTFPIGTTVTDSATLTGATANAGGTVTYTVYSNSTCTTKFADAGIASVSSGVVGNSDPVTFNSAGTYYWQAVYSGDSRNNGSTSACTDEIVTIVTNSVTINTLLSGQGQEGSEITIQIGNSVTDSAVLTGETANAGGTVTYTVFSNATCQTVFASGGTKTVTNGTVPDSNAVVLNQAGTFYWQASYSGDANNDAAISGCTEEIVTVVIPAIDIVKSVDDADHIVGHGQLLTYTLKLQVVNGPVTGSIVSDPLPVGQDFVSASDGGVYDAATHTITWNLGTLATGNPTRTLTYQVTVAADAATGDQVNTATFDTNETGPASDSETVTVPLLTIAKTFTGNSAGTLPGGEQVAKAGDTLTYKLTYDLANGPVNNGVITDTLPIGLAYVDGSATDNAEFTFDSYDPATRTLTWTASTVTADGSVTYQVLVEEGADEFTQPLVNVATIDSDETNEDAAEAEVFVEPPPLAATGTPKATLPPTSTIDTQPGPSNAGFGLMLTLLAIAGLVLSLGFMTPAPARVRRSDSRG